MDVFDAKILAELTRLPVRLVLDTGESSMSERAEGTEGVRRRDATSRHLLYQAEELYFDLRLEPNPRTYKAALVGQLMDLRDPLRPVSPVTVLLMSGDEVLAQTRTNELGELQMDVESDVEPCSALRLCVALEGGRLIEVTLDRSLLVS